MAAANNTEKTLTLGNLSWDEPNRAASLQIVYDAAVETAQEAVNWYGSRIKHKRLWAQGIRLLAIGCAALAGLHPMIAQAFKTDNGFLSPVFSSIFLAEAAALVFLDRFFGFSSGWMRFVTAEMTLRERLDKFYMDWEASKAALAGAVPNDEQLQKLLAKTTALVSEVHEVSRKETAVWIKEFSAALSEADKASLKAQTSGKIEGGVDVGAGK